MATVVSKVSVTTTSSQTPATTTPGTATPLQIQQSMAANFSTSGVAADQVNLKHTKTYTFVASTAQTLDLTSLLDDYGGAVAFVRIRSLTVKMNSQTDGATLTLSPGASNGWTNLLGTSSTLIMQSSTSTNNAVLALTAPNTTGWVVDSTHKTLTLTPSAHAFTVDIEITGCNA